MEEIKIILNGLNEEKLFLTKKLAEIIDYTSYNAAKVKDLIARRDTVDKKIDDLTQKLLPIK